MTENFFSNLVFLHILIVILNITLLTVVVLGIRNIKRYILDCHSKTYCNLEDNIIDSKSAVLTIINEKKYDEKFDTIFNKLYEMSKYHETAQKELLNNILISSIQSTKPAFSQRKDNGLAEKKDNVSVSMQISTDTNWNEEQ